MVRVKICGITSVPDACAAMDFGADAIGVVFAKSPRRVSVKITEKISRCVGPWISVVGVFVNESPQAVQRIARECGLSSVQLHGCETMRAVDDIKGVKVIKTFHVDRDFDPADFKKYDSADAFLFDTKIGAKIGGTGVLFDWKLLKKYRIDKPLIVSGGLHPGNVARAVEFFRPYGVDVSSGVEKSPGKKDLKLMREFIRNAKFF